MNRWVISLSVFVGCTLAGYLFRAFVLSKLARLSLKTETRLDDLFIASLRRHIVLWFALMGALLSTHWTVFSPAIESVIHKTALTLFFLSFSLVVSSLLTGFVEDYAARLDLPVPHTSLTQNLLRVVIFGIGALLVLSNLGISITPLLTALGVGSLAVALALQDTLSNLFAGIYILANQNIKVGHFIRLESGQEGFVMDIGWRAARIRELSNNIIIVPNVKLSQTIVVNYYLQDTELAVLVPVTVSYGSDLDRVEKITCEVGKEVMRETAGGVPGFEPLVRYGQFGESGISFTAVMRGKEYADQYLIRHEFIKRLHARYNKEGIVIPFPQRTVHLQNPAAQP